MSYTQYSALKSEDVDGLDVKKLRENEYIAYTAVQMLSKDKCLKILSQDKSMLAEAQELLPDMEEEEALCYLHESVETVAPFPKSDHYEIGYPAKFSYFFEHEDSMPLGIIRHGIFLRNTVLSDDTLYSELRGEDGSTGQIFKKHVRMSSLAHVKKLKENIAKVLQPNPVWQSHILRIIEEIKLNFPNSEIDISIFNPGTGILTIYNALTKSRDFYTCLNISSSLRTRRKSACILVRWKLPALQRRFRNCLLNIMTGTLRSFYSLQPGAVGMKETAILLKISEPNTDHIKQI